MKKTSGISWISVAKIGGAWVSFCIGSGFATGQELLQYFGAYGALGFGAIVIAMILHGYAAASFLTVGNEQQFERPIDAFDYYCGPVLGKLFKLLSIVFLFLSPVVMIAGFGASVMQHFGLSSTVGATIIGVACIVTILLGLRKMVDILGVIGPIIIIITLFTGGIWLINHVDMLAEGVKLAPTLGGLKMGMNWVDSGVLYAAWAPMISLPFLAASATTVDSSKDAALGGVLGTVFYGLACAMMVAAFFTDYANVGNQMVPTLYLANNISPILGYAFLTVIFLGIYSSAVPSLFNFCASFCKEGTSKHRIFTIVTIIVAIIVAIKVPFGNLLNGVYTFYGYLGMLFFILIPIKQIRVKRAGKAA